MSLEDIKKWNIGDVFKIAAALIAIGYFYSNQNFLDRNQIELRAEFNSVKTEQSHRTARLAVLESNISQAQGELKAMVSTYRIMMEDLIIVKTKLTSIENSIDKIAGRRTRN